MEKLLAGRSLLWQELPQALQEKIKKKELIVKKEKTYTEKKGRFFCGRCQAEMMLVGPSDCYCQKDCAYCRQCLQMGKVRKCEAFYSLPEKNEFQLRNETLLAWTGELSPQQNEAAQDIIKSIEAKEERLLWAVAGAGKTEMLFLGIEQALKEGARICIASPRIDVCLELAPRIEAAFPTVPYALLYGEMEEPYDYRQLTLATTHQLLRFKEAFDLLIIDEIDAFPFDHDPHLQFAAQRAKKEEATVIYLSATPNRSMQKAVKSRQLAATILPARYHGHPLPQPKDKYCRQWQVKVLSHFSKTSFGRLVQEKIKSQKKFLIFLPEIAWMLRLEKELRKLYPDLNFASVYASDPDRKAKVLAMRAGSYDFLMTTTILERGVTFPNIDVLVLGADDRVFTESALVQIAGRCGRAADYPTGEVVFFHDGKSLAMKRARQQIQKMNRLAKERGLLK